MMERTEKPAENTSEVVILRPQLRHEQIAFRGQTLAASDRRNVRKALRALHTLEIMAVTVYRCQITRGESELNRELIAAMCNEMTHVQDFQVKLCEYGINPGLFRWTYWIAGLVIGMGSCLLGKKTVLKTGIWVESKAVAHYAHLLAAAPWDDPTRHVIEINQENENGHIRTWRRLLDNIEDKDAE